MCHIASVTWSSHWSYPFSQDYVGWTAKINHSWVIIEPKFRASVEDLLGLGLCNGMDLDQEDPQQIFRLFHRQAFSPQAFASFVGEKIYIDRIGRKKTELLYCIAFQN